MVGKRAYKGKKPVMKNSKNKNKINIESSIGNQPLPHNLESERIILGTILKHGEIIERVLAKLKTTDFYRDSHKNLFNLFVQMNKKDIFIDISTVVDQIKSNNIQGEISKFEYLTYLMDIVASVHSIDYHIKKVFETSNNRKIHIAAINYLQKSHNNPNKIGKLFEDLRSNIDSIDFSDADRPELINASDLVSQDRIEPQYFIDDIIPKGSIVSITAPPSFFKTWLALYLSACLSEGSSFLSNNTTKSNVIYINKENPSALISYRLRLTNKISDNLYFWNYDQSTPPPDIYEISAYKSLLDGNSLLVFDSLIRFHNGDENSSSDMSKVFSCIRELTVKGDSVLVIHHRGKSEGSEYRGSSEIKAGIDVSFIIEKKDNLLTLKCTKHRYKPEFQISFKIVSTDSNFSIELAESPSITEKKNRIQDVVDTLLRINEAGNEPNQTELVDELHDYDCTVSKKKWRGYVLEAEAEKKIKGTPTTPNNQIRYKVNESVFPFSNSIVEKNGKTGKRLLLMPDEPSFS